MLGLRVLLGKVMLEGILVSANLSRQFARDLIQRLKIKIKSVKQLSINLIHKLLVRVFKIASKEPAELTNLFKTQIKTFINRSGTT